MSAKAFVEWAHRRIRDAQAVGAELELFVMPEDAEMMLYQAAAKEQIPVSDYSVSLGDNGKATTYLAGVKVLWTKKLPNGQAWFRYRGGKQENKAEAL